MKKSFTLLFLSIFLLSFAQFSKAQVTQKQELIASYSADEMTDLLKGFLGDGGDLPLTPDQAVALLGVKYDVDVYRVTYNTPHPILGTIPATGALAIPTNVQDFSNEEGEADCITLPLAVYQHGTIFGVNDAPSNLSFEHNIGAILASGGYITAMPDYLGLGGESPGMHPYVHAKTQATAGIDLMRATRELQGELDYNLNGENFLFGYSQGGHAAMALFYEIETFHSEEFTVTAAAPMSGPYDLSISQGDDVMFEEYSTPSYLPYVLVGYQSVYPDLLKDFTNVFRDEFAILNDFKGDSEEYFSLMHTLDFPSVPIEMLLPEAVEEYKNDQNHPLRIAMRENDRYDWTPKAPVQLLGCCDDEQVMIENTEVCYAKFVENGAADVDMVDFCDLFPNNTFGHGGCVPFCLLWGKQFFDRNRGECVAVVGLEDRLPQELSFYPNPASGQVQFMIPDASRQLLQMQVSNINGQQVAVYNDLSPLSNTIDISGLDAGIYVVEVLGGTERFVGKLVVY